MTAHAFSVFRQWIYQKSFQQPIRILVVVSCIVQALLVSGVSVFRPWDAMLDHHSVSVVSKAVLYGREIALPDDRLDGQAHDLPVVYQLEFDLAVIPEESTIYLPFVRDNAQLQLNGFDLPVQGRLSPGPVVNWHRTLSFPLWDDALQPGQNTLKISVYAQDSRLAVLGRVYVGPDQAFHQHRFIEWVMMRGVAFIGISLASVSAIGLLIAASLGGRIFWLASAFAPWTVLALSEWLVINPPFSAARWFAFSHIGMYCSMSFALYFAASICNMPSRWLFWLAHLCWPVCLLNVLVFLFPPSYYLAWKLANYFDLYLISVGILIALGLIYHYLKAPSFPRYFSVASAVLVLSLSLRDLAAEFGWLPPALGLWNNLALLFVHFFSVNWLVLAAILNAREMQHWRRTLEHRNAQQLIEDSEMDMAGRQEVEVNLVLARTVNHEFNNPLASVLTSTMLLEKICKKQLKHRAQVKAVTEIKLQSERCQDLVLWAYERKNDSR